MADNISVSDILRKIRLNRLSTDNYKVGLVIPDLHDNPKDRKDRFKWIARFASDRNPDFIVCLGDMADFDSLCGHVGNDTLEGKSKPAFQTDLESLASAMMVFDQHLNPAIPLYYTEGNHEHRIWRFENENPEAAGTLSNPYIGLLDHYRWKHCRFGEYINVHGVDFTHRPLNGMGKPFGGMNAAVAVVRDAVRDTVFGDSHKYNFVTKAKIGQAKTSVLEAGCAMEWGTVKSYARKSMTGWWWGVTMIGINNGCIVDHEAVSMLKLERAYS